MKKFLKYFMLTLVVSAFILGSCSKSDDDDPAPPPAAEKFDVLKDYMLANDLDVGIVISDWFLMPQDVNAKAPGDFFIIDIRNQDDYDAGHIEGAVHSVLGDILTTAEAATKQILVVCYTGQEAGHGVIALRLSGYSNAQVLKWGMCGWTDDLAGKWESNVGDAAIGNTSWIVPPGEITPPAEFNDPVIETSFTEGADILAERVDALLANGFGPNVILNGDVLGNPAGYFINNYLEAEDVEQYGNIVGAYRLNPFTLTDKTYKNLDPSKTIVSYCWTGQTSSMLTAYLYILGYDVKSLKFGMNAMIYSELTGHKWALQGNNFPVFPTK
jgi:rhodanese-related sulfurtransferase